MELIQRLHDSTTACFTANNQMSQPIPVRTGIRQGCPLAPLRFLLAIEVLGHTVRNHPALTGLRIEHATGEHRFSGFVDDSALFLRNASQLPNGLSQLQRFGQVSGLQIQPTKSALILLNQAHQPALLHNIPVLLQHQTTRYLGLQIGINSLR